VANDTCATCQWFVVTSSRRKGLCKNKKENQRVRDADDWCEEYDVKVISTSRSFFREGVDTEG
jgi:hypothetical protein